MFKLNTAPPQLTQFTAAQALQYNSGTFGTGLDVDAMPPETTTSAAPKSCTIGDANDADIAQLARQARLAAQNQDAHAGVAAGPLSRMRFGDASPVKSEAGYQMTTLKDLDKELGVTTSKAQEAQEKRLSAIKIQYEFVVLAKGTDDPSDLTNIDLERSKELKAKLSGNYGQAIRKAASEGRYNTKIGDQRVTLVVVRSDLIGVKKEEKVMIDGVDIFSGEPLEAVEHTDILALYDELTVEQKKLVAYIVMTQTEYRINPNDNDSTKNNRLDAIEALLNAVKSGGGNRLPRNLRGKEDDLEKTLANDESGDFAHKLNRFMKTGEVVSCTPQNAKPASPLPSNVAAANQLRVQCEVLLSASGRIERKPLYNLILKCFSNNYEAERFLRGQEGWGDNLANAVPNPRVSPEEYLWEVADRLVRWGCAQDFLIALMQSTDLYK